MSKWLVIAGVLGMLVTFAGYAIYASNEVAKRDTYIGELEDVTDGLITVVAKQADMYDADQQRLVSAWHVREMELMDKISTLETAGQTDDPLMLGKPVNIATMYASDNWEYIRVVENIATTNETVDAWLMKDDTPVEPENASETTLETPWGTMYWHGLERVNACDVIGWHTFPKEVN